MVMVTTTTMTTMEDNDDEKNFEIGVNGKCHTDEQTGDHKKKVH